MRRLSVWMLPAAACLWVVLLVAAPIAASRGALPVLTFGTYECGSLICHQKPERSFAIAGVQMPVCGRCSGLYLAGAAGAAAALVSRRRRNSPEARLVRIALAAAAVPMLLSVGLEWFGFIGGSNASRFMSALPLGLTAGWLLQRTIAADASMAAPLDAISFPGT